jgi:hypothetical protein
MLKTTNEIEFIEFMCASLHDTNYVHLDYA